ncbi:MAG TPA: DNA topoisomerase 3 [Atribacteraceae bacterium]|nr:DNA topoisomerase 3 [Atribacteraceae bacterium]
MGKTLIITEKPSVARDLARVLGKFTSKKEYLESPDHLITWAIGHLVTLAEPEDYDRTWKVWRVAHLPIIPDRFKLKVIDANQKRFKAIKDLLLNDGVDMVVNACDAGREGELIFRYIYELSCCDQPFKRLWLSSLTAQSIREAFANLRPGESFDLLADAARCRSEGDWLVGINGTRIFTTRFKVLLSVGRVQTPTLAILVHREKEIQDFTSAPYWEIFVEFSSEARRYVGKWTNREDRTYDREQAQVIRDKVAGQPGVVTEYSDRRIKEAHPLLYDLTELQRDANKLFGLTARRTLNAAQKLYEARKLITYPRTDSRYLSDDLFPQVEGAWSMLRQCGFQEFTGRALDRKEALEDKRVFNTQKISDHHAIIPTGENIEWDSLKGDEYKIMDLVTKRFVSVFFPDAQWAHRRIRTEVAGEPFVAKSKVLIEAGWRSVYGESAPQDGQGFLPELRKGDSVTTEKAWVEEKETKAPPRYSEATLLSAMEAAGRFVEDEELREAMKESGIGTPATRASIIERLIEVGYLDREGKTLIPTPKGIELINLVEEIPVAELASPQLTGEWEKKLTLIEKGAFSRETFLSELKAMTREMVGKVKDKEVNDAREKMNQPLGKCPLCSQPVIENRSAFACSRWKEGCPFTLWKRVLGRAVSRTQALRLITAGKTDKIAGFRSKKGRSFAARLVLQENGKIGFEFDTPVPGSRKKANTTDSGNATAENG